jgi:hypothetical protein
MYPVLVNATFQVGLGVNDRLWVWRSVIQHVGVLVEAIQIGLVSGLTSCGQEAEVFQDIVLCMRSYPVSASWLSRICFKGRQDPSPYITVYGGHHPIFSLTDRCVQTFSLAGTLHSSRSPTYGTVRVHPDDRFTRLLVERHGVNVADNA